MLLILLVIEKVFTISRSPKLFVWFFWLYNAGVILTSAMLLARHPHRPQARARRSRSGLTLTM